jgi:ABC-type lipoprotein release transport system permease subunit
MSAVGLGLFLAILYVGISDGMLKDASDRMDRTGLGHVQIHAPGFREEHDVALAMEDPVALLDALPVQPEAKVSTRVVVPGLLGTARGTRGVQVLGVDPEADQHVDHEDEHPDEQLHHLRHLLPHRKELGER